MDGVDARRPHTAARPRRARVQLARSRPWPRARDRRDRAHHPETVGCSSRLRRHGSHDAVPQRRRQDLVDRPRPHDGLVHATAASFPSGHAAFAGATLVALVVLFSKPCSHRRVWWVLGALGMICMASSRTHLQVHWLVDVVAGSLLGAGVALMTFASLQVLMPPRRGRSEETHPRPGPPEPWQRHTSACHRFGSDA